MIPFIVPLPRVCTTDTKRASDLLQRRAIASHHVEAHERLRAVFLLKPARTCISRPAVKLLAPGVPCCRTDVAQTGDLPVSEPLPLDFCADALVYP